MFCSTKNFYSTPKHTVMTLTAIKLVAMTCGLKGIIEQQDFARTYFKSNLQLGVDPVDNVCNLDIT